MDGNGYMYLENQAFLTSCNFSPLLMFEFKSISRFLASLEKGIVEFSTVCKNECPDVAYGL